MRTSAAIAALALAACPPHDVSTTSSPISGGEPDPGDPAVVALVDHGAPYCTGVLVAPRVVLTAAHCGDHGMPTAVAFGPAASPDATASVLDFRVHPAYDGGQAAHDLALLLLASPSAIVPASLLGDDDARPPVSGTQVRIVGYGQPAQAKTVSTAAIAAADAFSFVVQAAPGLPCAGDSGGPAFVATDRGERVLGIVSRGDPSCAVDARYARADAEGPGFIVPYVEATRDGSRASGERCFFDDNCAEGACVAPADAPRIRYCSRPCAAAADCPAAMACQKEASGRSCQYPTPSPGALGSACTSPLDCEDSDCAVAPDTQLATCSRPCVPGPTSGCPVGFACRPTTDPEDGHCYAADGEGAGCSIGGAVSDPTVPWILLLACRALVFWTRRSPAT